MFVDKVKIMVRAGDGGHGAVAFHREKYVANGGPDGGDGGKGGNIVLRVNDNLSTLMDFRYKRKYAAPNGQDGQGARCKGERGEDLIIKVPRGTVVRDAQTGEVIKDISDQEDFILCKEAKAAGATAFCNANPSGVQLCKVWTARRGARGGLELKLLADVGLVGLSECWKIDAPVGDSDAKPKIANYHFTTLFPISASSRWTRTFVCHGGYPRHH